MNQNNFKNQINSTRKAYCFLGLPASGKGTQTELLAKKIAAKILGAGDMIRGEIANADLTDPFSKSIEERYKKGIPQPDEVILDIVKKNIIKTNGNIILDNFPFSKNQTDLFFQLCQDLKILDPVLVVIEISKEEALKRVLSRKICSHCGTIFIDSGNQICEKCGGALITRSDDNEETLKNRIGEYLPRTEEVKKYFALKGTVITISGEQSIKAVEEEINKKVLNE